MKPGKAVRLDRLLASLGYGSRAEVQAMIAGREVRLDGAPVRQAALKVVADAVLPGRLQVRGAPLDPPPPLTIMLHKPAGLVCSRAESGRSVYELFPERWRRRSPALSTIGRLDADTTGLLLVTDDGELLHQVISPRRHVPKRYRVDLESHLTGREVELFASGALVLEGEAAALAPAALEPLGSASAYLTITEGRYHQVKRMFAAAGNLVIGLHRDRIGGLDLATDLAPGEWRVVDGPALARLLG